MPKLVNETLLPIMIAEIKLFINCSKQVLGALNIDCMAALGSYNLAIFSTGTV
jgi:hypothetical protein